MIQAMGATTVAVDLSELYLALRQGVADGQDTPPSVVKSNKYYEVQKYISKTEHVLTTAYTVTNPKFYDSLTADEKTAFNAACADANTFLRAYTVKDESEAYEFLKAQGMQVNLTPDVESFRVACAPVIEKNPDLFVPELVKIGARHAGLTRKGPQMIARNSVKHAAASGDVDPRHPPHVPGHRRDRGASPPNGSTSSTSTASTAASTGATSRSCASPPSGTA